MKYKVILSKGAAKYYRKLDASRRKQIDKILIKLQTDPYSLPHVKRIQGSDFEDFRVRFGDFRLLYRIINGELIILVLDIGPRGDIYKS
ncbi:type II toxin-antitoxin system RelE/ParE family toxin [Ammoniphilus sp. 3BR4]|uniref:type II toxin-antitoxin system RelE family toxin n=1 Tax=Ammoniphilus sp. 3BR4 TaxID=3158265 RepID=UPI0034677C14